VRDVNLVASVGGAGIPILLCRREANDSSFWYYQFPLSAMRFAINRSASIRVDDLYILLEVINVYLSPAAVLVFISVANQAKMLSSIPRSDTFVRSYPLHRNRCRRLKEDRCKLSCLRFTVAPTK
jgi:hypothetical protein